MVTRPDQQVGMEDIFEDEVATTSTAFPSVLPSTFFPDKRTLSGVSAMEQFVPLMLDEESYLKKFATPTMTDEQIEKAFAVDDGSDLRNMAIAKLGFSLLQPTEGGRIGPAIAQAGQALTNDLMKIKQQQKKEQKASQIGMINAKMKRDAQNILDRKSVFDMNRQLLTTIAGKEYDASVAADKVLMDLYKSQVQAATSKFQDYQLEGVKPKKVQVALRDAEGGVGEAFSAFVVQSIQDDGSLSAPQYYKPSNDIGTDGLPMMELIANPESIVEISLSKTGGKNKYGQDLFENDDEKQAIFNKLGFFDTELSANEVRANSIIYAIARARKSSGRLNLDDIERAAKDLNIYGDSSVDVIAKIGVLRTQLERSRDDALGMIKLMYSSGVDNFYDKLIDMGYATYQRDRTLEFVTNPESEGFVKGSEQTPTGAFDYSIGVSN